MNTKRRTFLKGTLASSAIAVAVGAGLLNPRQALAAAWPKSAFDSKDVSGALKGLFNTDLTIPSPDIDIRAPDIAENGAIVPVTVSTKMKGVNSISLIVEDNPNPLAAKFNLASNTLPNISTRVKMGKTSNVIAVVQVGDKVYSARKEVKVTIGGCGG